MKDIQVKSVKLFGFMRIAAYAVTAAIMIFACVKGFALAPHAPDIALQTKLDLNKKSTEKQINQKAHDKVEKYKEERHKDKDSKKKDKSKTKKDASKGKKDSKGKKAPKKKEHKPKTKAPKPSKQDKKKARKHKADNLS